MGWDGLAGMAGASLELGCRLQAADEFRPRGLCLGFCDQSRISMIKEEKKRTVAM